MVISANVAATGLKGLAETPYGSSIGILDVVLSSPSITGIERCFETHW